MSGGAVDFAPGGFAYMPGVFQYSGGVVAAPGMRIERVRFATPLPLAQGFARIEAFLREAGRPLNSFCACELNSPAPFTEDGFKAFNQLYVGTLERWGLYKNGVNPVARANTCPAVTPPPAPSFHAFCFTTPSRDKRRSFVVAGSGEAPEGKGNYRDHIVARAAMSAPPACARRPNGCSARWSAGWPRSAVHGRRPPRCSSTPCTTSIPSSRTNSRGAARCVMA